MREIDYTNYFWQDDKIRLRSLEEKDWEMHHYNRFDTPGRRRVNCLIELPSTQKEAMDFVEEYKEFPKDSSRIMFTVENLQGEVVGGVNLNSIDERNGTFSVGMLIDTNHRSKGYGTAAMKMIFRYAFLERRLNKYYGGVIEGNIPSATMLEKCGCVKEGVRRQTWYMDGKYHDMILYGLLKDEFVEKMNV